MKIGVYQVYFDAQSKAGLQPGFIPYGNFRYDQLFENAVILDLYRQKKPHKFDLTGVVSWRFFDKTGITYEQLCRECSIDLSVEAYNFSPHSYCHESHPYSRKRCPQVIELARLIDERGVLPFKLERYDTEGLQVWCNYWVSNVNIFSNYVENYLIPLVKLISNPDKELAECLNRPIQHRDNGVNYTVVPFFLEGLFSVFAHREQIKIKSI